MTALHEHVEAARLEDIRWLAETGETASGAARRLGMSFDALEKWCRGRASDEWRQLLAREPRRRDMTRKDTA